MQKYKTAVLFSILTWLFVAAGLAQSLGDAARPQRQKKPPKSTTTSPKVITNDDIGASVPASAGPAPSSSTPAASQASSAGASDVPKKPAASDDPGNYDDWAKAGKEWKSRILAQKAKIQSMQSYVDKLRSSVHFATKNPGYDASLINLHELQKVDEAKRLEKQLNEENATLQSMQDAARGAGYDASVCDPREETGNSTAPPSSSQD
jgi:hypothetical protein